MGVVLKCTRCGATGISSLFYLGPDAHACKSCGAPFELADPRHDRRSGGDRRVADEHAASWAEWRSGEDRRRASSLDPKRRLQTPAAV